MKTLYLIARVAGERIAVPAIAVDSVVKVTGHVPVPSSAPFVAGLFALRSRVLTLIDSQYFITGDPQEPEAGQPAVIVAIEGHSYALLVDEVLDVIEVEAPPVAIRARMRPGWAAISAGMLDLGNESLLLLAPERLVNPAALRAA